MSSKRKNPEELLQQIHDEELKAQRGKLKIYLGAAPGVGKTYEMLHDAQDMRAKELDVLVGLVESHGRGEIENMLKPFEILPRQPIDYRGKTLFELDIDAILKRNPGLVLIDEMAHTNAPSMRHAKRWQDIKELLDCGIDVYTTLNVQHIESLNDDVAQIIQAPIYETVPDSMIEIADKIELIDLPPEELLQRLKDGKVYFSEQATLAAEHFFRKGNLIALRELALRVTAEKVNAEVLTYRQGEGIKHIWPVKEKILVCVSPRPTSLKLIRAAKRIASGLQASWLAVYVDVPTQRQAEQKRNDAIVHLRLAEQLGAQTHILTGFDPVKEIIEFARAQNVTQIMIRKNIHARWLNWLYRNLADDMVRHCGEIDVYIMTGESHQSKYHPTKTATTSLPAWKIYGIAICMIGLVATINFLLKPYLTPSNMSMLFFLGIIGVAFLGRVGASILASILCIGAYDYLFTIPSDSFKITHVNDASTLILMFVVTQIVSQLIILTRRQAKSARLTQQQTAALYAFSRQLTKARDKTQLLQVGTEFIARAFHSDVAILLPRKKYLIMKTSSNPSVKFNTKEHSIAQWVYEQGQMAGRGTSTLSFAEALFIPLSASAGPLGVLKITPQNQLAFTPEQQHLLEACISQLALALEVVRLQEKENKKELKAHSEQIRAALLQAISFNLHMPLINIIHTMNQYMQQEKNLARKPMLSDEIGKLNQLNYNISQVTQLEAQNTPISKEPTDVTKLIHEVIQQFPDTIISLQTQGDNPMIPLNKQLIQDTLMNLINNSVKFAPPNSPITIVVCNQIVDIKVSVEDHGPGIAKDELSQLFKKFYRSQRFIEQPGLGLGLSICHKIIEAHGGSIWAENLPHGGAAFRFTLPKTTIF